LIENVFDVYRLADAFEVKLTRGADGRPMPPLQHYLTNYKDEEVARSEFRKARTALRTPRTDLPPMTLIDANEQMLLDLLANFARTLTPPTTVAGAAAAAAAAVAPGTAATATGAAAASEPEVIEHLPAPTPEN
jgi:hypothetical protein